jgi:ribonuclease HI
MSTGTVEIWTDGACLGNPGPGGWAAILKAGAREREVAGGEPDTTNNRMELLAAISALEALTKPTTVRLVSDSEYVIKGITEWLPGWRARGWKKVKNRDLWERLAEVSSRHEIAWEWVRGHSGDVMNERVDKLAVAEAERQKAGAKGTKAPAKERAASDAPTSSREPSRVREADGAPTPAYAVVRVDDPESLGAAADLAARITVTSVTRSIEDAQAQVEVARLRGPSSVAYFVQPTRLLP